MPNCNRFWLRVVSFVISLYGVFVLSASEFKVKSVGYSDEFNGSISPELWSFNRLLGLSFASDTLTEYAMFTGYNSNTFPYLRSYLLPQSLDEYEIKFRLSHIVVQQGAGIILSDSIPSENIVANFSSYMFYVWPKPDGTFHIFTPICPVTNTSCNSSQQLSSGVYQIPSNQWVILNIKYLAGQYVIKVDGVIVFTSVQTTRKIQYIGIGQPEITGSTTWPNFDIDYIRTGDAVVNPSASPSQSPSPSPSLIPSPTPSPSPNVTPTSSPSPSPTPTPTPSPSATPLPTLAYYSQSDPRWASQIYDTANNWAKTEERGIVRWGCALTSVAMVLKQYGVKTLNGLDTTPSTLNSWLKNQRDGYIREGYVNWLAISRYAHESYLRRRSPMELEYSRSTAHSLTDSAISSNLYPIIGVPGHFVAVWGSDQNSYLINDPNNVANTHLAKTDEIESVGVFRPSQTDLSYMLFAYDLGTILVVRDQGGNTVTGVETNEYLHDDVGGASNKPLNFLYIPKPSNGRYEVQITNQTDTNSKVDMFMYDKNGNSKIKKITVDGKTDTAIELRYNKSSTNKCQYNERWKWVRRYFDRWQKWIEDRRWHGWSERMD